MGSGWFAADGFYSREGEITLRERNFVTAGRERASTATIPRLCAGAGATDRAVAQSACRRGGHIPGGIGDSLSASAERFQAEGDELSLLTDHLNQYSFELPASRAGAR